jgi:hypothetical protein
MPDEWLDLEAELYSALLTACERQGLHENLARLIATDAMVECRRRILERMRDQPSS